MVRHRASRGHGARSTGGAMSQMAMLRDVVSLVNHGQSCIRARTNRVADLFVKGLLIDCAPLSGSSRGHIRTRASRLGSPHSTTG